MNTEQKEKIRRKVRENYGKIAETKKAAYGCAPGCCSPANESDNATDIALKLGYENVDMQSVPDGANMGLGCGNPQAIADLKLGETVLDLGSGGGFDCFLAARAVGEKGQVIGVDMTPEMISKSRQNAENGGFTNVHFRLGEIEYLPVADNSIDTIISNCVINLSCDKEQVFRDAFRVLKPGGNLAVSDIVTTRKMPEDLKSDMELYAGCIAGASTIHEIGNWLQKAGFENIEIQEKPESHNFIKDWSPNKNIADYIVSATIKALKPIK